MMRRFIIAIVVAVLAIGVGPVRLDFGMTEAAAQSRKVERDRPNFFQRLFGIGREKPRVVRRGNNRPATTAKSRSRPQQRKASEPPAPVLVEVKPKDPDARKIMVVGDFVATGLAAGLDQTLAEEPQLVVIDKSEANSGLVRTDRHDWNEVLPGLLNETQPDVVVIAVGANDRQAFRDDAGGKAAVRSDSWTAAYNHEIEGMVETLRVYGRPFFWVGMPPMRATAASSDMAYFNSLYKPPVQAGSGHFVDIWNGFANEDGRYVTSGPDVEGQVRQLRTGDGINFTRAGRLKLAFYVDREIRRQTGFGSGGIDLLATVTQGNRIEIGPDGSKRLVGPVISLSDPLPGSSGDLAGAAAQSEPAEDSPQFKVITRGESPAEVGGRVDDFAWPPRKAEGLIPAPEPLAEAAGIPRPVARPN